MKVLKEGTWKNQWSAEFVCKEKSCGTKLLVSENDLCPRHDKTNVNFFVCPVCGAENNIPPRTLPKRLKDQLNNERRYCDVD